MRYRHQRGCLLQVSGSWVVKYREHGHQRKQVIGRVSEMTKSEAQAQLDSIVAAVRELQGSSRFKPFAENTYFPFYERKWKTSTAETNSYRIRHHLLPAFGLRELAGLTRVELQDFLDEKAGCLSFSTVDHLRWDLRQILELAVAEGLTRSNPARLLFTPRAAEKPVRKHLSWKEVKKLCEALDLRDRLIVMLAIVAGMRPGEIFALQWRHLHRDFVRVQQRVYRGKIDTPKTENSVRDVALSPQLQNLFWQWQLMLPDTGDEAWVFPSENGKSPLRKDNVWRRDIKPQLELLDLAWANFQVMRRTHATLMRDLGVDPKLVADQQGHTLDVNLNIYTQSSVTARKRAVKHLESRVFAA